MMIKVETKHGRRKTQEAESAGIYTAQGLCFHIPRCTFTDISSAANVLILTFIRTDKIVMLG